MIIIVILIHDEKTNIVAIIDPSDFYPCDKQLKKIIKN